MQFVVHLKGEWVAMELLIVARHGEYSGAMGGRLTQIGQDRIQRLAAKIKDLVGGRKVAILASTAPRGLHSAEIISEVLGVPFTEHEVLWSDDKHTEDMAAALELVKQAEAENEVVVLVTHFEYAEQFPTYFGKLVLGAEIPKVEVSKSHAKVVDCTTNTCETIGPV